MKKYLIIIFVIISCIFISCNKNKYEKIVQEKFLFGTYFKITVYSKNKKNAEKALKEAFEEIERIDKAYNIHIKDSFFYNLNEKNINKTKLNDELIYIFKEIDKAYTMTNGKYDITIRPLIELWQNEAGEKNKLPSDLEMKENLSKIDYSKIKINENNELEMEVGQKIDTGSFLKGYAIKKAKEKLVKNGIENALITAVSSIDTINGKNEKENWRIALQNPENPEKITKILKLNNKAVGVSGDYQNYYEIEGKKYHHIIDKYTGYPIENIKMIVVVADDSFIADIYSTALFTVSVEKALEIAEKNKEIEIMIIDKNMKIITSKNFEKYLDLEKGKR